MRAIQLLGGVLSTDEAASVELRKAEAVHQTRSSHCLFKAAPTTPCICREQQLETGLSNKRLKRTLELLLHCGGLAEPRLLHTEVPHTAAVVWMGTTGTRPAHNRRGGGGGSGHFSPAAMYCTTTWCFALKGLRIIMDPPLKHPWSKPFTHTSAATFAEMSTVSQRTHPPKGRCSS